MKEFNRAAACAAACIAAFVIAALELPATAQAVLGPEVNAAGPAVVAFERTYAGINDYTLTDTVVEQTNDGARKEQRVFSYKFLKPNNAVARVVSGRGSGSVAAWHGGDTVKGHVGGFFSAIKLTLSINDPRATSMRGHTIDEATFTYTLASLLSTPGTLREAPGPAVAGVPTTAVTLDRAQPTADGVTRSTLFLSDESHLPVRRETYAGSTLVVNEEYSDLKTNVGLKPEDIAI